MHWMLHTEQRSTGLTQCALHGKEERKPTPSTFVLENAKCKMQNAKNYSEVALEILSLFLESEIEEPILEQIVKDAYNFPVPLEQLDDSTFILRLDQGPTASFKDFAARFMAKAMNHLKPAGKEITILVATSGDTGSAVGEAFRGLDGFRVFIIYPENEVSPTQKHQLDSIGENVQAVAIDCKFDDCQNLVKLAFEDDDIRHLNLTSANSINIGRLLPQIAYYFYAWSKLETDSDSLIFSVPSGNFGNSLGGELAKRMGLPIKKLIIAVNENDEFPHFLTSGEYKKVAPSRNCLSNAMNVGNPSNLARYFDLYGGTITRDGPIHRQPNLDEMKSFLNSYSISDVDTVSTIKSIFDKYNVVVEPHGAVGLAALEKYRNDTNDHSIAICLETAHPAKFPETVEEVLQIKIDPHKSLASIAYRAGHYHKIDNNYESFKTYLLEKS